jgi:hypothetical protein
MKKQDRNRVLPGSNPPSAARSPSERAGNNHVTWPPHRTRTKAESPVGAHRNGELQATAMTSTMRLP